MEIKLKDGTKLEMTVVETGIHGDREYKKGRLSIFEKSETLAENLMRRHNRPHKLYRQVIPEAVDLLLTQHKEECKEHDITKETFSKLHWSNKAGCSCGCSPGFIMPLANSVFAWFTIKIKVK
jgi:hypothetical protein